MNIFQAKKGEAWNGVFQYAIAFAIILAILGYLIASTTGSLAGLGLGVILAVLLGIIRMLNPVDTTYPARPSSDGNAPDPNP